MGTLRAELTGRAYEWARCDAATQVKSAELKKIESDLQAFSKAMQDGVVMVVDADASRQIGSDVQALHDAYLMAIAQITARVGSDDLRQHAEAALLKLASNSPRLSEQLAVFHASTDELLRWKARVSEQIAKTQTGFAAAESLYVTALQKGPQFVGIYQRQRSTEFAYLAAAANRIMVQSTKELSGKTVWFAGYVGGSDGKSCTPYQGRLSSKAPIAAVPVQTAVAKFKQDLMLSEASVLSLPVAETLLMAERGDWLVVGGKISRLSLDSLVGGWQH